MSHETKLGMFVLFGLALLGASIMVLGDFQFQRTYTVNVRFTDVSGLPNKAKAKVAGVVIGSVSDIALEDDKAIARVHINAGMKLHRDSKASIVSTGIIGSKYLQFTVGSPDAPLLKDGDTIDGEESVSLERMASHIAQQIDELFSSLKGKNGENLGENLGEMISNLKAVSRTLKTSIGDQEEKLTRIVKNVDSFTADIADITADNKQDIRDAVTNIKALSARLDRVMEKVEKGDGTIGKLLSDQQMGNDLKDTFADVKETAKEAKRVLRRLNYIETRWDYTQRYDSKYSTFRADGGIKISPRPDKYYYIGVSNVGDGTTADIEKQNTINFLIGKDFGPTELYAGAIRSKGGVGVVVRPLWNWEPWRKLEITAQTYDMSRKTPNNPVINTGVRVKLTKWMAVGAQVEDINYQSNLNSYVNFTVLDDDLGYILGLVGLAKP